MRRAPSCPRPSRREASRPERSRPGTVPQQPAGEGAGGLAVDQDDPAGHHSGLEPGCPLAQATSPTGQVGGHFGHRGRDRVGVEDVQVGSHAGPKPAPIGETPGVGSGAGQHANGLFQGEVLALPYPIGEEVGLDRAVHDLAHVRARVRERHHRPPVAEEGKDGVGVLRGDRLHEQLLEPGGDGQIDHGLDRCHPAGRGHLGHRGMGRDCCVHDVQVVEIGTTGFGPDSPPVVAVLSRVDKAGPDGRVGQGGQLLARRPGPELPPLGQPVEGQPGPKREERGNPTAVALAEHGATRLGHVVDELEQVIVVPADNAETDRHTGVEGQAAQAFQELAPALGVPGPGHLLEGQLEDAGSLSTEDCDEALHLAPAGQSAGYRAIVRCGVVGTARGGQPDGAGAHGRFELDLHASEVVLARLLFEGPLAHGPRPEGRVADVGGVVDAFGLAVDRVEVLGKGLPPPVDPGGQGSRRDVLGPFQVPDDQIPGVGTDRGEGEPAVAHDHRGHPVPARAGAVRVPEDLRIHMGMAVDEPRRHNMALGVDLGRSPLGDPADFGDPVPGHGHVGPVRRSAGAVHHGAVSNDEVVSQGKPPG